MFINQIFCSDVSVERGVNCTKTYTYSLSNTTVKLSKIQDTDLEVVETFVLDDRNENLTVENQNIIERVMTEKDSKFSSN